MHEKHGVDCGKQSILMFHDNIELWMRNIILSHQN